LLIIDQLIADASLKNHHLLPSVRGDFLLKLGRIDEARLEFKLAASLTPNLRERELLIEQADAWETAVPIEPSHINYKRPPSTVYHFI
jgi:predicted RNA polymerase sigma factor